MNINWSDQLHNLRAEPIYSPRLPINTLDHCLAIIPAVKLIKNPDTGLIDSSLMLQPLLDNPEGILKHINGEITNKEYLNMLTFLGGINRSKLVANMKKNPRLGSLTPLGLYAYKLNHNIPYEAWDKDSQYFGLYLGKFLMPIRKVTEVPTLSIEELIEFRNEMQTVKTSGARKLNTDYRTPIKNIKGIDLPAPAVYMLLQLWIANAEFRNAESMILDPVHWDNIPEALDAVANQSVVGNKKVKEWWE